MTTCKGKHSLIEIGSKPQGPGLDEITRWCKKCGAVVIDVDVDGRISPGAVMSMLLPETETAKQRKPEEKQ